MRPVSSKADNEKQHIWSNYLKMVLMHCTLVHKGMGGDKSVMGVNIEHGSRHPSVISVAVKCWLLESSSRTYGI